MGTEKVLLIIIISVLLLSNIGSLIILANKNKKIIATRNLLKSIVIKNSNLFKRFETYTTKDLVDMLDDKIVYFENETKQLRNNINANQQKIKKLQTLNNIVSGHVNNLNKDVIKFISRLSETSPDIKGRDLETLGIEFKSALFKARQFFDGLCARAELLQVFLNKICKMKNIKIKNTSVIAVKSSTIKNRLYSMDRTLYNQNSELLEIVEATTKINKEIRGKIQSSLSEVNDKLQLELNKRSELKRKLNFNVDRNLKDLKFIDKELDIILENHEKESYSNRGDAIPVIVNDIKQKISGIENDLQSSSSNNTEILEKLIELDNSDAILIYQLLKGDVLFQFEKADDKIDHVDISRIISKSFQRNEYLLQMIADLIKESCITEELSNTEWERLREEGTLLAEMKKNVSMIFNLLNSININNSFENEIDIDLSNFSVSEDGEIII